MGIEITEGAIIASGRDGVRAYTLLAARTYLALEIRTGMPLSGKMSTLRALKMQGFIPESCKNKIKAYAILDGLCVDELGMPSKPLTADPPGGQ